ncbi:MAG: hypothetical protein M1835_007846 [Candelina submexicana]|nr:MAG: hypothetical protein M1835_007846 [Candelina submexicana]
MEKRVGRKKAREKRDQGVRGNRHSSEGVASTWRSDLGAFKRSLDMPGSLSRRASDEVHERFNEGKNTEPRGEDSRFPDRQRRFPERSLHMQREERKPFTGPDNPRLLSSVKGKQPSVSKSSFQSRTPDADILPINTGSQAASFGKLLRGKETLNMTPRETRSIRPLRSKFPWEDDPVKDDTSGRVTTSPEIDVRESSREKSSNLNGFAMGSKREHRKSREPSDAEGRTYHFSGDRIKSSLSHRKERLSEPPLSIPYTTPASEFLYGTSVVTAALRARRRKLYKLYIYDGEKREVETRDSAIYKLGLKADVEVQHVEGDWLRMLDKMSTGRPHNGYILEASPLPKLPVTSLLPVSESDTFFDVELDHQSREEEIINGVHNRFFYKKNKERINRYPFVLMLDEILDPGNLGAILRTAYFLGVDAVAISTRNSAPFSPVALKASAGASENIRLLSIHKPPLVIESSLRNGWQFYAAVAPDDKSSSLSREYLTTSNLPSLLTKHPCVLMLGGEGEGLRHTLRRKAGAWVGIEGDTARQGHVDSLNVSVAAGILCEAFLRKSAGVEGLRNEEAEEARGERMF